MKNTARSFVALLLAVQLFGCSSIPEPEGDEIKDLAGLEEALSSFYQAEYARDWRTYWSYFNDTAKNNMPYEDLLEQMKRAPRLTTYKILSIKNHGPDNDAPDRLRAQVEVKVERTVKESANYYGVDVSTDLWWNLDGQWQWVIRR